MHYCLPGVVDTFSRLLFSSLLARPSTRLNDTLPRTGLRFHRSLTKGWLTARGAALSLEVVRDARALQARRPALIEQWWWPFRTKGNCSHQHHPPAATRQ